MLSAPGTYSLQDRILASEIPAPLLIEHQLQVTGGVAEISENEFFDKRDTLED